ncbi:MAG: hypothetical protein A4E52_00542 [Pelotomaculum sp. PtaB.Bin013]|uniref:DUF2238 domain-containing protein n=1 Tax=Pelotomaculum isophthalicicum JI TaxID=947010 RepID=A0A9X4JW81_9FIRM|nr:hypothetical protein [Pelotomaculum isophthalicicum]MDF9408653.1 hypothetical protein [Pelotomaculum isophthalicicum JI]OPX91240.1 MAG: hypothetical protein A4E52_00542 [Pelotomaculum sp. PtaB.Bin013]
MQKQGTRMILTLAFLIVQLLTFIELIRSMKYEYVYDVGVTTVFLIIYTVFEVKFKYHLSNYIRGTVILTIIGHNFFGEYLDLYITSPIFDRGLHIFGTYAFVLFIYSLLYKMNIKPLPQKSGIFIYVVLLGISLGTLFEIVEFLTDIMLKPEVQYQTDLVDTDLDLVCDVIGAIIAAFHINKPYGFNIKKS